MTHRYLRISAAVLAALVTGACGFKHAKYENPISKDTQQPDKILFDKSIKDIEKGRYEVARLTLNTLINTYDTSEYLAKAKLAVADSWYREGGLHGLTQAEAEYKDFILFYPTMEEAAESQEKICMIHYKQMDKADRDPDQALRAEQECRQLLTQFPNSKFAPQAEQLLRDIQEVLGEAEMRVGIFYHSRGSLASSANRLGGVVEQYPLYSRADEALFLEGDSYSRMGPRFRKQAGEAYTKLVRDYPLSKFSDDAKKKLTSLELPIPDPDPAAVARMKFDAENLKKPGMYSRSTNVFRRGPDTYTAAKTGTPQMNNPRPNIPANVPPPPAAAAGFAGDVTVAPVTGTSALDTNPDARTTPPTGDSTAAAAATPAATTTDTPDTKNNNKKKNKKNNKKNQPAQTLPETTLPPANQPQQK
ncbi:MAG TPA: outer membrane protein assembly factor BamD [Bryobacteraceae bacterium]|nr:outer membrane protein assembly factor BamD [Bryobacteraceae bacterium]